MRAASSRFLLVVRRCRLVFFGGSMIRVLSLFVGYCIDIGNIYLWKFVALSKYCNVN